MTIWSTMTHFRFYQLSLLCIIIAQPSTPYIADDQSTNHTLYEQGKSLYVNGLRNDNKPISALVSGDVEILGTQFSCKTCHGHSGMGSMESDVIVPSIAGPILFEKSVQPARAAYNFKSFAHAIRTGMTPSGRKLDSLMPKFNLTDQEIKALMNYLETFTIGPDPGVNETNINFAFVVTDNVDADKKRAVLNVLEQFLAEKNRQTRLEGQRLDRGTAPAIRLPTVYRDWTLHIWELSGDENSWTEQLTNYYQETPVFAMLNGLIPLHPEILSAFCEANKIPCILPSTLLPEADRNPLYTLYFSKGLRLEAELIYANLKKQNINHIIQISCDAIGNKAASYLTTLVSATETKPRITERQCGDKSNINDTATGEKTALVFWSDEQHFDELDNFKGEAIYLSSSLLKSKLLDLNNLKSNTLVAHTHRLPNKRDPAFMRFVVWAKTRKINITHPLAQSDAFFSILVLKDAIKHIDRFYVRDYVIDILDHMQEMAMYLPHYAAPSFGPGQSFVNKSGFLIPVNSGKLAFDQAQKITP